MCIRDSTYWWPTDIQKFHQAFPSRHRTLLLDSFNCMQISILPHVPKPFLPMSFQTWQFLLWLVISKHCTHIADTYLATQSQLLSLVFRTGLTPSSSYHHHQVARSRNLVLLSANLFTCVLFFLFNETGHWLHNKPTELTCRSCANIVSWSCTGVNIQCYLNLCCLQFPTSPTKLQLQNNINSTAQSSLLMFGLSTESLVADSSQLNKIFYGINVVIIIFIFPQAVSYTHLDVYKRQL